MRVGVKPGSTISSITVRTGIPRSEAKRLLGCRIFACMGWFSALSVEEFSSMERPILLRRRVLALSGGVLAVPLLASGIAHAADDWPTKPVRYINVFPPGGPTDTLSRIVCQQLSELTGQQFIVENKSGSGGNVGTDAIAKAAPDGYTIGLYSIASQSIAPTLYGKLPFDVAKDFTPIAMLWSVTNMLMVRLDLPARTIPELIELVRKSPGKYSFASSGSGTTPHIAGELFKQMAKLDILHVPYRGSAPAYQDLLAGQVDMMFDNIPGPLALMRSDKARGLAVTSLQRHPAVPEIPTMAEFLAGFEITSWGGICGPAGLPPAMVERLSAVARQALESAPVKANFAKQGATNFWLSPADTNAQRIADEKRLAPVIKASGAKVD
jgi:tripartite-type tricarboxylate transporter receptor subunit TctC